MSAHFPEDVATASTLLAGDETVVIRAGGTDLQERWGGRLPLATGLVDLTRVHGLREIRTEAGGTRIGAMVTVAKVARELATTYPALSLAAAGLATPQIRGVATVGGNLLQHTRCPYARHRDLDCYKTGGQGCPAREGEHSTGVLFDTSACVHPHPSSLAMALLLFGATFTTTGSGEAQPVGDLYDDDPRREHRLEGGHILTEVRLPPPVGGETGGYVRAISRFEAEWPLAEAAARIVLRDGRISEARVAVGGVAPTPLLLEAVASALRGERLEEATIAAASARAVEGMAPLPGTAYKADLLIGCVADALRRAAGSPRHGRADSDS
ncbi:MAG: FAD binding domain-containing protein [Ornithinimicrobium sp.]